MILKGINFKHNFFKNSFFPICGRCMEQARFEDPWLKRFGIFLKANIEFVIPKQNSTFKLHNHLEIKLLTRLRVGLSHLKEHKFNCNFKYSIDNLCSCGNSIKSITHFFLHCTNYTFQRQTVLNKRFIDSNILANSKTSAFKTLLFGKSDFRDSLNKEIINAIIGFILSTNLVPSAITSLRGDSFSIFILSSPYLVFNIISHFKSRCSYQKFVIKKTPWAQLNTL